MASRDAAHRHGCPDLDYGHTRPGPGRWDWSGFWSVRTSRVPDAGPPRRQAVRARGYRDAGVPRRRTARSARRRTMECHDDAPARRSQTIRSRGCSIGRDELKAEVSRPPGGRIAMLAIRHSHQTVPCRSAHRHGQGAVLVSRESNTARGTVDARRLRSREAHAASLRPAPPRRRR
jgi:hypothetical protein